MTKKFLITTPIYYPNWYPHIWHAYASFIADFYARYKRLLGYEVKFSTWNDENSQKIVQQAEMEKKDVMGYLDEMGKKREQVRTDLQISYTDFIRTTQKDHKELVQKMLQKSFDKWDIYEWEYKWYYCVWCEWFKTEKDLIERNWEMVCPDHLKKPDLITEKNRFFKLKNYSEQLKELYKNHPNFLLPWYRFNEVISFVNWWLEDFSVSRETNKFWIPLPFDPKQVTYVRYDALFNYVTVCEKDWFRDKNTEIVHVLGKDISRFHAIFWPAMLMSAELKLPNTEYITWRFTVDWHKMSKSLWNVIDPIQVVNKYDRDAVIFNLLYDVPIWSDWDFSEERLKNVYESMLIWSRWNLVNRVTSLCSKYWITKWQYNKKKTEVGFYSHWFWLEDTPIFSLIESEWKMDPMNIEKNYLNPWNIQSFLIDRYSVVQATNVYITQAEPRKKYKDEATKDEAISDLQFLLYIVKQLALLSSPILVNWFKKIQEIFGNNDLNKIDSSKNTDNPYLFKEVFDLESFEVNLNSQIIYQKKE